MDSGINAQSGEITKIDVCKEQMNVSHYLKIDVWASFFKSNMQKRETTGSQNTLSAQEKARHCTYYSRCID